MATALLNTNGRPAPLTVSIKRIGDGLERFISLQDSVINFFEAKAGLQNYRSVIMDSAGVSSEMDFTLNCLSGSGLEFTTIPIIQKATSGPNWLLALTVNLSGTYLLKITNTTTGIIRHNANFTFTAGVTEMIELFDAGDYKIELSDLFARAETEDFQVKPSWLTKLGITNNVTTRATALYLGATLDCSLKIKANDGTPISGKTHDGSNWSNVITTPGTSQWAANPWSEMFFLNPAVEGVGGLVPGSQYDIEIFPVSNPSSVFRKTITIPVTSHTSPFDIDLGQTATLPACAGSPIIATFYTHTASNFVFDLDMSGVERVRMYIKNAATNVIIRTQDINMGSGGIATYVPSWRPNITLVNPLPDGVYKLGVEGLSCSSAIDWSDSFTVGSGGDPDPDPVDPGDIIAKTLGKGMDEHMKMVVIGTGEDKVLSDLSTLTPPSGNEFRYLINEIEINQSTPLTGFPWPCKAPVGIFKFMPKVGAGSLVYWGSEGWQDPNLCAGFSYNSSAAFAAYLFEPENSGYDMSRRVVHWMDHAPDAPVLSNGSVWIVPHGRIDTPAFLMTKGITHFYGLDNRPIEEQHALQLAGKTYFDVPKTMTQLSLNEYGPDNWVGPPGGSGQYPEIWNDRIFHAGPGATQPMTNAQATAAGNNHSIDHAIIIWENSEQYYAVGGQWPFWRYFYAALTARLEAKFPGKWRIAHNYFTGIGGNFTHNETKRALYGEYPFVLGTTTRSQAKAFLSAPLSEFPSNELLPGGVQEKVNSICYGVYLNAPDSHKELLFRFIHNADLAHKAGKYFFVFIQSFYEWRPNNISEIDLPGGKFYQYIKLGHNPCTTIDLAFLSRVFGDGFIPWSSASKTDTNFRWLREFWNNSLWIPTGYTSPQSNDLFPFWGSPEQFPGGGFEELVAKGMWLYFDTFAQTIGGTRYFCKYRKDGGSWIDPAVKTNISDVIDATYDNRGFVMVEILGSKMAGMWLNPYEGDGNIHEIEFLHPTTGDSFFLEGHSILVDAKLWNL